MSITHNYNSQVPIFLEWVVCAGIYCFKKLVCGNIFNFFISAGKNSPYFSYLKNVTISLQSDDISYTYWDKKDM